MTCSRAMGRRQLLAAVALSMLGIFVLAGSARAENPPRSAQAIASRSDGSPSERSGSSKVPRKPLRKPDGAGSFVHELIDNIRAQSQDFCARYGNSADCLEEAEVCLTMLDTEDNRVRLCLNSVPGESGGDGGKVHRSRMRR